MLEQEKVKFVLGVMATVDELMDHDPAECKDCAYRKATAEAAREVLKMNPFPEDALIVQMNLSYKKFIGQ